MHAVLRVNELLTAIFDFTVGELAARDGRRGRDLRNLAALARVCRVFYEPAIDRLWSRLDSIYPLLRLLRKGGGKGADGINLPSPDWVGSPRYYEYACRVKHIIFDEQCDPTPYALIASLARATPLPLSLAPRVRTLAWDASTPRGITAARHFISPALQHFDFFMDVELEPFEEEIQQVYSWLSEKQPKLKTFAAACPVSTEFITPGVRSAGASALCAFSSLNSVRIDTSFTCSIDLMRTLAHLPKLYALQVTVHDLADVPLAPWEPLRVHSDYFPALETLILEGWMPAQTAFLLQLPVLLVREIICYLSELCENQYTHDLLSAIALVCGPSLTNLLIHNALEEEDIMYLREEGHQFRDDLLLDMRAVAPAMRCPNLVEFNAQFGTPLHLTDGECLRLARAWPRIELLELSSVVTTLWPAPEPESPPATLAALAHFAAHCPRMRTLGLFLDATGAEAAMDALRRRVPSSPDGGPSLAHPLELLQLGPSRVSALPAVQAAIGQYLMMLYKSLPQIGTATLLDPGVPHADDMQMWYWFKTFIAYQYYRSRQGPDDWWSKRLPAVEPSGLVPFLTTEMDDKKYLHERALKIGQVPKLVSSH